MNKKLLKASVAGVAVAAIAFSGSTFAAWSDFGEESTGAGAGILKLNLSDRDGTSSGVAPFSLAPGQNKTQEFFLASADAGNVPTGILTGKIQNLDDIEDGGPSCTTNSERVAEGGNGCGTEGELADEMKIQVLASQPVASQASCPNTGIYGSTTPSGVGQLDDKAGTEFQLGELEAGEGVCVRMEASLPKAASTNASQGDEVTYDWRFDLTQK